MTQQFGELEAGAALDARVAEILGWEVEVQDIDDDGTPLAVSLSRNDEWLPELPEFSVSHEAAAKIKQFLGDQLAPFTVYHTNEKVFIGAGDSPDGDFFAHAESEPLALCRFLARLDEEGVLDHD